MEFFLNATEKNKIIIFISRLKNLNFGVSRPLKKKQNSTKS